MNLTASPATQPTTNAPLFLMAAKHWKTSDAPFSVDFQDLYSLGMDRAIGLEKASLDASVRLQLSVIDMFENAPWLSPAYYNAFEKTAQVLASCMELQMTLMHMMTMHMMTMHMMTMHMMTPHAMARPAALPQVAAPARKPVRYSNGHAGPAAEGFEHSMDIAIGALAA